MIPVEIIWGAIFYFLYLAVVGFIQYLHSKKMSIKDFIKGWIGRLVRGKRKRSPVIKTVRSD